MNNTSRGKIDHFMCVSPYIAESKDGKVIPVPCGHCVQCLKDFQNQWSFRLSQECRRTIYPIFITLTYNDEHLPIVCDDDGVVQSVLRKKDFQDFIKRFRRYNPKLAHGCRYFAVGEYGAKKNRAHFHAVLILPEIRWSETAKLKVLNRYLHRCVSKAWSLDGQPIGFVKVQQCQKEQIRYVTKYMNKLDKREHLVKPFRLMSKSIGLNYLSEAMVNYYLTTFNRTCKNDDAVINLPRYYVNKLDALSNGYFSAFRTPPQFREGSMRGEIARLHQEFTDNYLLYYRITQKRISHLSRVCGYQYYEPTRHDVYSTFYRAHKVLQDAVRISNEVLDEVCIKNKLNQYVPITPEVLEYG